MVSSVSLTRALSSHPIGAMFEKVDQVDAVVATVGSVPFKPFEQLQRADFLAGLCNKALGQVEIERQGVLTSLRVDRSPAWSGGSRSIPGFIQVPAAPGADVRTGVAAALD